MGDSTKCVILVKSSTCWLAGCYCFVLARVGRAQIIRWISVHNCTKLAATASYNNSNIRADNGPNKLDDLHVLSKEYGNEPLHTWTFVQTGSQLLQDSLLNTSMRHSTPELSFGTAQCGFSGSGGFVGVSDSASRIPDSYGEEQLRPKPAVRHARQPYMAPCFSWTTTRQALPVRCVCLFLGWDCPAPMSTNQIKHEDSIYWSLKHLLSQHLTTFYKSFIGESATTGQNIAFRT